MRTTLYCCLDQTEESAATPTISPHLPVRTQQTVVHNTVYTTKDISHLSLTKIHAKQVLWFDLVLSLFILQEPVHDRYWQPTRGYLTVSLCMELGVYILYSLELQIPRFCACAEVTASHEHCFHKQPFIVSYFQWLYCVHNKGCSKNNISVYFSQSVTVLR